MLQRHVQSQINTLNIKALLAYPNKASRGVFEKIGYKSMVETKHYSKVLLCEKKLFRDTKYNQRKGIRKIFQKILSAICDSIFKISDAMRFELKKRKFIIDETPITDYRNDFKSSGSFTNSLITVDKNNDFYKWRFKNLAYDKYKYFAIRDSITEYLLGFCIYQFENCSAVIIDAGFKDKISLRTLILEFSKKMRTKNVESIIIGFLGSNAFIGMLNGLLFFERKYTRSCMIYSPDGDYNSEFYKGSNWLLFDSDMDL
jgi:hypothetical protein